MKIDHNRSQDCVVDWRIVTVALRKPSTCRGRFIRKDYHV